MRLHLVGMCSYVQPTAHKFYIDKFYNCDILLT